MALESTGYSNVFAKCGLALTTSEASSRSVSSSFSFTCLLFPDSRALLLLTAAVLSYLVCLSACQIQLRYRLRYRLEGSR